jgi:hypothetical protein
LGGRGRERRDYHPDRAGVADEADQSEASAAEVASRLFLVPKKEWQQ